MILQFFSENPVFFPVFLTVRVRVNQGCSVVTAETSAGWRGHLIVVGTFEEGRIAAAHLQRSLAGDVWGAASTRPGVRVEELARVVGAVAETWVVETGMVGLVHLLGWVTFHEQVDGHDACTLPWRRRQEVRFISTVVPPEVSMEQRWFDLTPPGLVMYLHQGSTQISPSVDIQTTFTSTLWIYSIFFWCCFVFNLKQ